MVLHGDFSSGGEYGRPVAASDRLRDQYGLHRRQVRRLPRNLRRALLGNVVGRHCNGASCPVLVVPEVAV
jgi:hypothetical protein